MTYSEQPLCLKDDALVPYEKVAVALKKKGHETVLLRVKSESTNLGFPCLRYELWFEVVPVPQVFDLLCLFQRQIIHKSA